MKRKSAEEKSDEYIKTRLMAIGNAILAKMWYDYVYFLQRQRELQWKITGKR
jgi:hypothetical protein